jgi:hypothetical protein
LNQLKTPNKYRLKNPPKFEESYVEGEGSCVWKLWCRSTCSFLMSERCLHSWIEECVVQRTSWNVGSLYTLSDGHYNEIYDLQEISGLVSLCNVVLLTQWWTFALTRSQDERMKLEAWIVWIGFS